MKKSLAGLAPASAPGFGVTWGGPPRAAGRALTVAAAAAMIAGMAGPAAASTAVDSSADPVSVIVRELPGAGNGPERAVSALGGTGSAPLRTDRPVAAPRLVARRGVRWHLVTPTTNHKGQVIVAITPVTPGRFLARLRRIWPSGGK